MFGFNKKASLSPEETELLNQLYNFILAPTITERERQIGKLAKADLEKQKYGAPVAQRLVASFQKEAMKTGSLSNGVGLA